MNVVYHYTTEVHLGRIYRSGFLRPTHFFAPDEKPLLWFSTHPHWEPSIVKAILQRPQNRVEELAFEQVRDLLGCARFLFDAQDPRLMARLAAYAYAGMPKCIQHNLDEDGRLRGADPESWSAVGTPIALHDVRIQVLRDNEWTDMDYPRVEAPPRCLPTPRPVAAKLNRPGF